MVGTVGVESVDVHINGGLAPDSQQIGGGFKVNKQDDLRPSSSSDDDSVAWQGAVKMANT